MAVFNEVKFDGLKSREWIVYRHPCDQVVLGTQMTVKEGQTALFMKDGKIADMFGPGRYTLTSDTLPMLKELTRIPSGGTAPFPVEIYYLNTLTKMDVFWGTPTPIQLIDPQFGIKLRVRAFGQMALKLKDCRIFYTELVGAMSKQDVVNYDKICDFYQGLVVAKVKVIIAENIIRDKISALDITLKLEEISENTRVKISEEFEKYGLETVNFVVQSINFPDEDFKKVNEILEQNAEFNILGDARYTAKRSFDVFEGAATNQSGGAAGAILAGGLGMGGGIGAGAAPGQTPGPALNPGQLAVCPHCGEKSVAGSKFCSACGKPMTIETITCPRCGNQMTGESKFCNECGAPLQPAHGTGSAMASPDQVSSPDMDGRRTRRNLYE